MPPRNGVIQKPRNAKGTLRRLGRYLWQSAPLLILALGLSVSARCRLVMPEPPKDEADEDPLSKMLRERAERRKA